MQVYKRLLHIWISLTTLVCLIPWLDYTHAICRFLDIYLALFLMLGFIISFGVYLNTPYYTGLNLVFRFYLFIFKLTMTALLIAINISLTTWFKIVAMTNGVKPTYDQRLGATLTFLSVLISFVLCGTVPLILESIQPNKE